MLTQPGLSSERQGASAASLTGLPEMPGVLAWGSMVPPLCRTAAPGALGSPGSALAWFLGWVELRPTACRSPPGPASEGGTWHTLAVATGRPFSLSSCTSFPFQTLAIDGHLGGRPSMSGQPVWSPLPCCCLANLRNASQLMTSDFFCPSPLSTPDNTRTFYEPYSRVASKLTAL